MNNDDKSPRYYLIAAIIWTIFALAAMVVLFMASGAMFGKLCGMVLIAMCLIGQWMRYFKKK